MDQLVKDFGAKPAVLFDRPLSVSVIVAHAVGQYLALAVFSGENVTELW
jgi:hypothetical protein